MNTKMSGSAWIVANNWPISLHPSSETIGKKLYFFQLDFLQEAGLRLLR
jgi:hypothetical protein